MHTRTEQICPGNPPSPTRDAGWRYLPPGTVGVKLRSPPKTNQVKLNHLAANLKPSEVPVRPSLRDGARHKMLFVNEWSCLSWKEGCSLLLTSLPSRGRSIKGANWLDKADCPSHFSLSVGSLPRLILKCPPRLQLIYHFPHTDGGRQAGRGAAQSTQGVSRVVQ